MEEARRRDARLRQRLERGEAAALGELYDRFAPLVHGLARRVLGEDQAAAQVTHDVFALLWEAPERYEPAREPLRSHLAASARVEAVRRLRQSETEALMGAGAGTEEGRVRAEAAETRIHRAAAAARADYIARAMPRPLREAIDQAYARRRTYRQTAADLGITEEEARRRLRLGLQLLSTAHDLPVPGAGEPST
ncbi:sigma-70 family RNA polymerase sigma factor [Streptomyces sp. NPDC088923]|uniref:sigma-70 family RNA polymerase sigma factor n=1 Tax=Streptomyces sp. NPDC088923 TaxID=3365913 RepID=UPI00382ECB6B